MAGSPFVLPNAWDVSSAKAVVDAGFPVVATTSAGVADALGYDDHEGAPAKEMLAVAARIVRSVDVPVTVDAEAGYGMSAGDLVAALFDAGVAGCNLEDTSHAAGGLVDPAEQASWLAAVRRAADDRRYGLVINARVDVFLAGRGERSDVDVLAEGIERANRYLAAGADCVYPIFLSDERAIAELVGAVDGPVNILALPQAPPVAHLAELGVARVSYGAQLHRYAMQQLAAFLTNDLGCEKSPPLSA